jgi:hypothetical protein
MKVVGDVKIIAVMVARVKKASAMVLHHRQNAFKRKHGECHTLHASGAREDLERAVVELKRMAHPVFEAYTLHPVGWVRAHRPKTKEQAEKWMSAIRRGMLPEGAHVFAKPGEDLLMTGGRVGILFLE